MKVLSRLKIQAESWFDTLNEEQKKAYLEEHPDSKYAKNYKPSNSKEDYKDFNYDEKDMERYMNDPYSRIKEEDLEDYMMHKNTQRNEIDKLLAIEDALKSSEYSDSYKEKLKSAYKKRKGDLIREKAARMQAVDNFWKEADEKWDNLSEEDKKELEEAENFDRTHPNAKYSRLIRAMALMGLNAIKSKRYDNVQRLGRTGWYTPYVKYSSDVRYRDEYKSVPTKENVEKAKEFVDNAIKSTRKS